MALVTVFNADSSPVHVDAEGRVLGAGEHGQVDPDFEGVAQLVAEGRLIIQDTPETDDDPDDVKDDPKPPKAPKPKATNTENQKG